MSNIKQQYEDIKYAKFLRELKPKIVDSSLSATRVHNPYLRKKLADFLNSNNDIMGNVMFEGVFPWKSYPHTLSKIPFLHADVVASLQKPWTPTQDTKQEEKIRESEYTFGYSPYQHQYKAWESIIENKQNVLVSSGTSSGKTECFMVPIINEIYKQNTQDGERKDGVKALMLYPLNALIEDQQDRLDAWLGNLPNNDNCGGDNSVTYCMYNGNTPKGEKDGYRKVTKPEVPWRHKYRQDMIDNPADILITNKTMLEYMLIRAEEKPILDTSQGTLKYIILDEVHCYLGTSAGELALLLRRVFIGFGVKAEDIQFIATSATIGDQKSKQGIQELKQFIADLSGANADNINVIIGQRKYPKSYQGDTDFNMDTLESIYKNDNTNTLEKTKAYCEKSIQLNALRNKYIVENQEVINQNDIKTGLNLQTEGEVPIVMDILAECSFLPTRMHSFVAPFETLYACANPTCSGKDTNSADWHFGKIYFRHQETCEHCQYPLLHIMECRACYAPYLGASYKDKKECILEQQKNIEIQEYVLEEDPDNTDTEVDTPDKNTLYIHDIKHSEEAGYKKAYLLLNNQQQVIYADFKNTGFENCRCNKCEKKGAFATHVMGYQSVTQEAVTQHILKYAPKRHETVPHEGQRTITFTDSRQGTARQSGAGQLAIENTYISKLVFEILQSAVRSDMNQNQAYEQKFRELFEVLKDSFSKSEIYKKAKQIVHNQKQDKTTKSQFLSWQKIREKLQEKVSENLTKYLKDKIDEDDLPITVWNTLLANAIFGNYSNRSALYNLGLIKYRIPIIEKTKSPYFKISTDTWKHLLYTYFEKHAITKMAFGSKNDYYNALKSFRINDIIKNTSALNGLSKNGKSEFKALVQKIHGSMGSNTVHEDEFIEKIVDVFQQLCKKDNGDKIRRIDYNKVEFTLNDKIHFYQKTNQKFCTPVNGFCSISQTKPTDSTKYTFEKIEGCEFYKEFELPNFADTDWHTKDKKKIDTLKAYRLWTDTHDAVTGKSDFEYFRLEEHTAQIARDKLKSYENDFKQGLVNVLNCTTTMEMGINIGGLNSVVLSNIPPSPANYKQRVGRAGRQGEVKSFATIVCNNSALGKTVLQNPTWAYDTPAIVPFVTLGSTDIALRHVNALILSEFIRENSNTSNEIKANTTRVKDFFTSEKGAPSPAELFAEYLDSFDKLDQIEQIIIGTVIESWDIYSKICLESSKMFQAIRNDWANIRASFWYEPGADETYKAFCQHQEKAYENKNLISHLAEQGFLPTSGLPTNVISLQDTNKKQRTDITRSKIQAIREYIPGNKVTIKHKVREILGISLGEIWIKKAEQEIRYRNICKKCGRTSITHHREPCCREDTTSQKFLEPKGFILSNSGDREFTRKNRKYKPSMRISLESDTQEPVETTSDAQDRFIVETSNHSKLSMLVAPSDIENEEEKFAICSGCGHTHIFTQKKDKNKPHKSIYKYSHDCTGTHFSVDALGVSVYTGATRIIFTQQIDYKTALSIGYALRRRFCNNQQIHVSEMNVLVQQEHYKNDKQQVIYLFDGDDGGTKGFAIKLAEYNIIEMLQDFINDQNCLCTNQSCTVCLVDHDNRNHEHQISVQYIRDFLDQLPQEKPLDKKYKIFGNATKYLGNRQNLYKEIKNTAGQSMKNPKMQIVLPQNWRNVQWNDKHHGWDFILKIKSFAHLLSRVEIFSTQADIKNLNTTDLFFLKTSLDYVGIPTVITTCPTTHTDKFFVVLYDEKGNKGFAGFDTDENMSCLDNTFLQTAKIVMGKCEPLPIQNTFDFEAVIANKVQKNSTVSKEHLENKFADSIQIKDFTDTFLNLLSDALPIFATDIEKHKIKHIQYNDRYIYTPFHAILLRSIFDALKPESMTIITGEKSYYRGKSGFKVFHEWADSHLRQHHIRKILGEDINIIFEYAEHQRILAISFDNGQTYNIILDAGLDIFEAHGNERYQFTHKEDDSGIKEYKRILNTKPPHTLKIKASSKNAPKPIIIEKLN